MIGVYGFGLIMLRVENVMDEQLWKVQGSGCRLGHGRLKAVGPDLRFRVRVGRRSPAMPDY